MFKHLIVIIPFCTFVYLQIPQNIWAFKSYRGLLIQPSGALDWTVGRPNSTLKLHQGAPVGGELTPKNYLKDLKLENDLDINYN